MPLAWAFREPVEDVDAVVSSSHACAKAVRFRPGIPHLCYCHTPMRYAWDFELERRRFPVAIAAGGPSCRWPGSGAGIARPPSRVDVFVANSIRRCRADRAVLRSPRAGHPSTGAHGRLHAGRRADRHLPLRRQARRLQAPDLVVEAFSGLKERLLVVGDGQLGGRLRSRAHRERHLSRRCGREALVDLYRSARALVFPAEEDFGIAMAEAQACGTPVIALDRGGARDIVEHGVTGWLLPSATSRRSARRCSVASREELDPVEIRRRAERFSAPRFERSTTSAIDGPGRGSESRPASNARPANHDRAAPAADVARALAPANLVPMLRHVAGGAASVGGARAPDERYRAGRPTAQVVVPTPSAGNVTVARLVVQAASAKDAGAPARPAGGAVPAGTLVLGP